MKKCPFCAEEIQDEAMKCKHCGEFLKNPRNINLAGKKVQWYFRKSFIIIALCCVGPFALPLIWWHPTMKPFWKIVVTIVVIVLSWILFQASMESIHTLKEYYNLIEEF